MLGALRVKVAMLPILVASAYPSPDGETIPVIAASACESSDQVARVSAVQEGVRVRHAGRWTNAKEGTAVYAGDTVETRKGQRAALSVCGGGKIYVNQETTAVMRSRREAQAKSGELAEHSAKKTTQMLRTRDAMARSHGTYFEVKVQKKQSVFTVAKGDVQVRNDRGQVHVTSDHQSVVRAHTKPAAAKQVDAQRIVAWVDPLAETWKILTAQGVVEQPSRVALDSHGNLFVTDHPASGGRVVKLSPTGKVMTTWRLVGSVTVPVGIAVDAQDNVYVTDNILSSVQKFTDNGQLEATYDLQQFTPSQPVAPAGIELDAAGNMYVAAEDLAEVEKLSPTGQLLATWGSQGTGPLQFDDPQDVALDAQGDIYVADRFNDRIQKLSPSGQYILAWDVEKNQFPNDVDVDTQGNVYMSAATRVEERDPSGRLLRTWQNDAVHHLLTDPGQFDRAYGVQLDSKNNVYVADHYNNRIQKLVRNP